MALINMEKIAKALKVSLSELFRAVSESMWVKPRR